jgi:hypothetical protein
MGMDILTAGAGFLSFGIYLLIHVVTFRWVRPERLLKSLLAVMIAMMGLPVLLMLVFYFFKVVDAPLHEWVCAVLLAIVLQGLLCLVYVLCVFGPYETSIRMRLVREIAAGGTDGVSFKELSSRYNDETIVNIRLQRLTGSGDVIESNGRYRIARSQNLFFVFDIIPGVLKKWINQ